MTHGRAVRSALRQPTRELRQAIPAAYEGFSRLHEGVMRAGALEEKTKELIALALSVSQQCDGCIAAHAQASVRSGATPQEAAEAIGVTFVMDGGPATVYGARAYSAFLEYYEERQNAR